MSELEIEDMDLNEDEIQQQVMLHKITEQNNYESDRNEEDDEHGYQSKEKETKKKLMLVTMKIEKCRMLRFEEMNERREAQSFKTIVKLGR